jgi:glyoxylase-like metal-dependent hydrolase (beta-lactamase superfamily II)
MQGDITRLARNLWMISGDLPADLPNVLVYRAGDRLYMMDSGAGPVMRVGIVKVLKETGPALSFSLLNSHGHADHVGNNDVIHEAQAGEKRHFISEAGLPLLDPVPYFVDLYRRLSDVYDPVKGYQAHRLRWRLLAGC